MVAPPTTTKDSSYYLRSAVSGAIAACTTHVIMVPVDVIKTKMQLNPSQYSTTRGAFGRIVSTEGVAGLMHGLGPTNHGYLTQGFFKYAASTRSSSLS